MKLKITETPREEVIRRTNAVIYLLMGLEDKKDERYETYCDRIGGFFDLHKAYREALKLARETKDDTAINFLEEYPTDRCNFDKKYELFQNL